MVFKNHDKWGIEENNQIIIPNVYDSIFNFDEEGKICLACFKTKVASPSKLIKVVNTVMKCRYLNKKNEKLFIKIAEGDTCSVFGLSKHSVRQFNENNNSFVVMAKGKKYLVDKNFKQLTFKGYHNVWQSLDPYFYHVQIEDSDEMIYAGLINTLETEIIPHKYSAVKINPVDSLIMGCRAGIPGGTDDDVFDYSGKKVLNHHRHVELATKKFIIEKIYEPKEHYTIYNIETKEEKPLKADEVHFFEQDQILIRIKSEWFVYDLHTNIKKEKQY